MTHFITEHLENITQSLVTKGYCVVSNALPADLTKALYIACSQNESQFKAANIGRSNTKTNNENIRNDQIKWISDTPSSTAEKTWLSEMACLRHHLNKHLFLGLKRYESHFAEYESGHFYKKHLDSFKGNTNRVVSSVFYLNENWSTDMAGELVIYDETDNDRIVQTISPELGTLVLFLSEAFPHEVLPAHKKRRSIAGWFRIDD